MELKDFIQFLWVAGIVFQAALVVVLIARKVWTTFPVFTTYSVFVLCSAVLMLGLRGHSKAYFYAYWLLEAAAIALGFAVVYEIFRCLFSSHLALRKLARLVFKIILTVLFLIGLAVLVTQSSAGFSSVGSAVMVVEETARVIEVGLLMSLFLLSTTFGLHWRQQVFGIALGLGLFAAVQLITVTMRAQTGAAASLTFSLVRVAAFNLSLFIWLGYLLSPERTESSVELPHRSQLEQWNQAVMELIRQ